VGILVHLGMVASNEDERLRGALLEVDAASWEWVEPARLATLSNGFQVHGNPLCFAVRIAVELAHEDWLEAGGVAAQPGRYAPQVTAAARGIPGLLFGDADAKIRTATYRKKNGQSNSEWMEDLTPRVRMFYEAFALGQCHSDKIMEEFLPIAREIVFSKGAGGVPQATASCTPLLERAMKEQVAGTLVFEVLPHEMKAADKIRTAFHMELQGAQLQTEVMNGVAGALGVCRGLRMKANAELASGELFRAKPSKKGTVSSKRGRAAKKGGKKRPPAGKQARSSSGKGKGFG